MSRVVEGSFFARNSKWILILFALSLPVLLIGTRRVLRSNVNDVKSWLPPAYEETTNFNWYFERFPGDAFILVSWEGATLDDARVGRFAAEAMVPQTDPVTGKPLRFFQSVRTGGDLLDDLVENQGLSREAAIDRLKGSLIGPDGRQTAVLLTVAKHGFQGDGQLPTPWYKRPRKFLHEAIDRVYAVGKAVGVPASEIHLGGPPVDNVSIDVEGERSLMRLAGIAGVVGVLMAWWALRNWHLTFVVFFTALLSAGVSLTIVWMTGIRMNAILMTMPALVYVAAASGAIHLINYFRDAARSHGVAGAVDRAVRNAWLPLFLATGTTAFGLASLAFSELVPIRLFGLFSAAGVVAGFGLVMTLTPALLEVFAQGVVASGASHIPTPGSSARWKPIGEWIIRRHAWVLAGCFLVMGLGVYGTTRVETSVKLMRLFSTKARILDDYGWLEKHLGELVPLEVMVRVDKNDTNLDLLGQMRLVRSVQQAVEKMPEVGSALAAPTFARELPERPSSVRRATWNALLNRSRGELRDYLYSDAHEEVWRISARVPALTDLDYGAFIHDIKAVVDPVIRQQQAAGAQGISVMYTGLVPLIYKAQHSMLDGLILGFIGDLILIGVAMIMLMRNFSAGLLLMLPSIFPIALVFGAMGLLGIVVDTGTVMAPAVALGVTVDDAIHFMLWCRHGQEKGMSVRRSILYAYSDCAQPIYQSWGVIGLGLFSFAFSSFMPTQRFGYLMLTMLTFSSIANLLLLPALLASPLGKWFWRLPKGKAVKHHEEPAAEQVHPPEPASVELA